MGDGHLSPLCWDATYEIVQALIAHHPTADLESMGLAALAAMILALPDFEDDPTLVHEGLLTNILREWYEERKGSE
ncbi:MAG TPA: Fe-S cluster assembly protein IscX [Aggregatilineales bacterium]|nr:Fe-S cluster assembly protein IscX [Anaerolineales bacterium]HRE49251.1 Fe-S cluster assembly protein IscX [Aggregatilineales bacterium]